MRGEGVHGGGEDGEGEEGRSTPPRFLKIDLW